MSPRERQLVAGDNLRRPMDLAYLWHGKGRERMIEVYKNLGFYDVCECPQPTGTRYRKGSGRRGSPGMLECTICHYLIWPMQYIFECDDCCEPILLDQFPAPFIYEDLLCAECQGI